jgi:hypothetical protein
MFLAKLLLFVLLPLPLLAAGWFLVVMALGGAASAYQWATGSSLKPLGDFFLAEHVMLSKLILLTMAIAIACVVVAVVGYVARKMQTSWAWPLLATVLISLVTATLFLNIQYTGVSGQNMLTAGLGFGHWDWMVLSQQLLQGILPLAIGVWIVRDLRRAQAQRRALA